MKTRTIILFLLIMTMTMSTVAVAFAASGLRPGSTAYVTGDYLNFRDAPQGNKVSGARYGTAVTIVSGPDRHGYYRIRYHGTEYYAYGEYLTGEYIETPTRQGSGKRQTEYTYYGCDSEENTYKLMFVTAELRLALRKGTGTDDPRKGWLQHGEPVIILNDRPRNGYIQVMTLGGKKGWAYRTYLSTEPISDMTYEAIICPEHEDDGKNYWIVDTIQWYRNDQ
ncbi:MAG: SH3 domain-containing protein [Clostridia bacterium]|nr:SH3 domain-containing protein [Clostridia bacterium]